MEQILWHLLVGTRGGFNRFRLLLAIQERPSNAHQLAVLLGMDYRTVGHHLHILTGHQLVVNPRPELYGSVYFLSPWLESSPELLARLGSQVAPPAARRKMSNIPVKG